MRSVMVLLVAAGCVDPGVVDALCGPSTCTGCCTSSGRCEPGDQAAACGAGGERCLACSAPTACTEGLCRAPAGPGRCEQVALVTGTSTLRLTLEPVEALSSGPCGVRGEATRLIPLRLGQGGNLAVRLTTASALTPTLSLRTTCDDPRTAVPGSCVVAPATSGAAVLVARGLAPGTIFLEVNALEPGAGAVEVELWLDDAPSTCAAYRSFPLDAAALQVGVLNGGVFGLDVSADLALRVTSTEAAFTLEAQSCGGSALSAEPEAGSLLFRTVEPGRLVVQSPSVAVAQYRLEATPATLANCGVEGVLSPPPDGGSVTEVATLERAGRPGGCAAPGGLSRRYRVISPNIGTTEVRVTPGASWSPTLSGRPATCTSALAQCAPVSPPGSPATLKIERFEPGAGAAIVDVEGPAGATDFTIEARWRPVAPNDTCIVQGQSLDFRFVDAGVPMTVEGSLALARDDQTFACSPASVQPDLFFPVFRPYNVPSNLRVRVEVLDGGEALISRGCSPRACQRTDGGVLEFLGGGATLDDGIWVEGAPDLQFRVTAQTEVPPVGESCGVPLVVDGGLPNDGGPVVVVADLGGFVGDFDGACAPLSPDWVVEVPRAAPRRFVEATVRELDPGVVAVLNAGFECGARGLALACGAANDGGLTTRTTHRVQTRSQYVVVQSLGAPGRVELTLRYDDRLFPGDGCSTAPLEALPAPGTPLRHEFDFRQMTADNILASHSSCAGGNDEFTRDVFVRFTLSTPTAVRLRIESLDPSLVTVAELHRRASGSICQEGLGYDSIDGAAPVVACGRASALQPLSQPTPVLAPGEYALVLTQLEGSGRVRATIEPLP